MINKRNIVYLNKYHLMVVISRLSRRKHFKKRRNALSLLLIVCLISCSDVTNDETENFSEVGCFDTNCADYISQSAAQEAFNRDPECRNDLDADNDGIACEEPGNSVSNCANTSNCGCSNKPKSQCENDPCCKWIVGEGCKCA